MLSVNINSRSVKELAKLIKESVQTIDFNSKVLQSIFFHFKWLTFTLFTQIDDLLLAINCIDLTTLAGDDTYANVARLCWRAANPLSNAVLAKLDETKHSPVTTGAVCVYPEQVNNCRLYFANQGKYSVPIASVVCGFPAGQGDHHSTLSEIKFATSKGATEIDIVINRTLALTGQWKLLYEQINEIVHVCQQSGAHLKVILSYGELGSLTNIYKVRSKTNYD